jgi:SAM-dependent methyltransferase
MTKQAEREYATRIDQSHLFAKPYCDPRVFREFALVLDVFSSRTASGAILDMGCGPGWTSLFLSRAGYQVVGVDISERMIEIARERSAQENNPVEFIVGDMEELDLGRCDFDGVLFFDCLHHCPGYGKALERAHAHLRPGGLILLMETTLLHRYSRHARQVTREYGLTELGFSRSQLRQALRDAGFHDISFYHDPGPCYQGVGGFLKSCLHLCAGYFFYAPRSKNIVVARKE